MADFAYPSQTRGEPATADATDDLAEYPCIDCFKGPAEGLSEHFKARRKHSTFLPGFIIILTRSQFRR